MDLLDRHSLPWLLVYEGSSANAYELAWRLTKTERAVRVVRGHKMRTSQTLFDEFGAALQFPDYFGENWNAWDECMTDLEWMPAKQYVLVIARALEVLANEKRAIVQAFADGLIRAAETWAQPIERGESWDRLATPFHVILQVQPGERDLLADIWGRPMSEFVE